jgi:hypothetical protein
VHNRRTEGARKRALGRDRVRCRRCDSSRARPCRCRSRRSLFTMSNSVAFFVPAARFCGPGSCFPLHVQPPTRGGRSAGRRTGSPVALARRDTALARRGPSRATGTAPLGAPPWRFSAEGPRVLCPTVPPDHPRLPAPRPQGQRRSGPAASRPRSHRSPGTPLPAPSARRLRRRPS